MLKKIIIFTFTFMLSFNVVCDNRTNDEYKVEIILKDLYAKNPDLFGSNSLCDRNPDFISASKSNGLYQTLLSKNSINKVDLSDKYSVWLIKTSSCYAGPSSYTYKVIVRKNNNLNLAGEVIDSVDKVFVDNGVLKISFTSYAGICDEYHYLSKYSNKKLTHTLIKRVSSCE